MAKAKSKSAAPVQNRPLYSRISFLQQAATYLTRSSRIDGKEPAIQQGKPAPQGAARRLVTDLRAVSLKARIRLSPTVKQTMCKYCDGLLIEGQTCTTVVENKSKGGRKPWADMLVRKCLACGNVKRHPLNSVRQKRKSLRAVATEVTEATQVTEAIEATEATEERMDEDDASG
jgi:ribonuclease P protein subunit RPR2